MIHDVVEVMAEWPQPAFATGHVVIYDPEGFSVSSHVSILMGLGLVPKRYDPFVDKMDLRRLQVHFSRMRETITRAVEAIPDHTDYIRQQIAAPPVPGLMV